MARSAALGALGTVLVLSGCSSADEAPGAGSSAEADAGSSAEASQQRTQQAEPVLQVTQAHEETGGTLLEGPTFGEDGLLYMVDVMAPPGAPKVLRVGLDDATVEAVYTDSTGAYTSAQLSPADGRLYLTDILTGSILSVTTEGEDPQVLFTGDVDGTPMMPDDIAFDPDGNLFVTDTRGTDGPGWETPGRVVRVGTDGTASVLASDLPSPNGIVFDEDDAGLWVSQYNANRIDYLGLDEQRTSVVSAYPAIYVDAGRARVDSTAVDADGNVYQAFHGKTAIEVYSPTGEHLQTITTDDDGLESATNLAIAPGTTDGVITVSGPAGGWIYSFDALAEGTRQSNGG
jgi:lactonase